MRTTQRDAAAQRVPEVEVAQGFVRGKSRNRERSRHRASAWHVSRTATCIARQITKDIVSAPHQSAPRHPPAAAPRVARTKLPSMQGARTQMRARAARAAAFHPPRSASPADKISAQRGVGERAPLLIRASSGERGCEPERYGGDWVCRVHVTHVRCRETWHASRACVVDVLPRLCAGGPGLGKPRLVRGRRVLWQVLYIELRVSLGEPNKMEAAGDEERRRAGMAATAAQVLAPFTVYSSRGQTMCVGGRFRARACACVASLASRARARHRHA